MKKLLIIFFSFFLFLSACKEDDVDYGLGEYYVEFVTALGNEMFVLHNGNEIINRNTSYPTSYDPGERVQLKFSYLKNSEEEIIIHSATRIIQGVLDPVTKAEISSHPNDPIEFVSLWIGNGDLNILFYIEHKYKPHKISLWMDQREIDEDIINIYFLHDNNGDERGVPSHSSVSYDLYKILGDSDETRKLRIHFNTTNLGYKCFEYNY